MFSQASGNMVKITAAPKEIKGATVLKVCDYDANTQSVIRGTSREMKADSLRRRYHMLDTTESTTTLQ